MSRRRSKKNVNIKIKLSPGLTVILGLFIIYVSLIYKDDINNYLSSINEYNNESEITNSNITSYDLKDIPEYNGNAYVVVNNNEPYFDDDEITTNEFEKYSNLDSLGRCGVAYANVSIKTMPTAKREGIGMIKPSGWHTVKYDNVDGKYLYNRCHLIGYQLTGENANEKNLITCTRYMNTVGMLEFENKVAEYVKETKNHVMYRVTPKYKGDNLLASGVLMEALSVEDNGKGIKFNVYVYNVQEGISINYKDGSSYLK